MDQNMPTKEQIEELQHYPGDRPFVMVNLLRYRDGNGKEAYRRYSEKMLPMLAEFGAKVLWLGEGMSVFIGTDNDRWDSILLVEYPSKDAFFGMITSPGYAEANPDRLAAMERTVLIMTNTVFGTFAK